MIKIFKYIPAIDAFIVDPKFKEIADDLGLSEWNEVVWIGRFFTLDNDYGEHWWPPRGLTTGTKETTEKPKPRN